MKRKQNLILTCAYLKARVLPAHRVLPSLREGTVWRASVALGLGCLIFDVPRGQAHERGGVHVVKRGGGTQKVQEVYVSVRREVVS